jgi:hypothetical protein
MPEIDRFLRQEVAEPCGLEQSFAALQSLAKAETAAAGQKPAANAARNPASRY